MNEQQHPRTEISYLLNGADKEVGLALFMAGHEYGETRPEEEQFLIDWEPSRKRDIIRFGRTALYAATPAEMLHFSERTQQGIEAPLKDIAGEQYQKIIRRSRLGFRMSGIAVTPE